MPQYFSKNTNTLARFSLLAVVIPRYVRPRDRVSISLVNPARPNRARQSSDQALSHPAFDQFHLSQMSNTLQGRAFVPLKSLLRSNAPWRLWRSPEEFHNPEQAHAQAKTKILRRHHHVNSAAMQFLFLLRSSQNSRNPSVCCSKKWEYNHLGFAVLRPDLAVCHNFFGQALTRLPKSLLL